MPDGVVAGPCHVAVGVPDRRLRGWILSYSAFWSAGPVAHRLLPLNVPVLVIDVTGEPGVVTGPCSGALRALSSWREGVSVGLTPAGVSGLLGVPVRELAGQAVSDFSAFVETCLAERLASVADFSARFRILDQYFLRRYRPPARDPIVAAWWRLQQVTPGRIRVPEIAAGLGIGRRTLETGFRRKIGLAPGAVVRVARFQHALRAIADGKDLARTAVELGYADQPHLTRDIRAGTGLTPREVRAFAGTVRAIVQDPDGRRG